MEHIRRSICKFRGRREAPENGKRTLVCILRGPSDELRTVIEFAEGRGVLDAWKEEETDSGEAPCNREPIGAWRHMAALPFKRSNRPIKSQMQPRYP